MYYFIINPNSSSGKGLLIWKSIEPVFFHEGQGEHGPSGQMALQGKRSGIHRGCGR